MPTIERQCDFCATSYVAEERYLRRGQGRYCSMSCASKSKGEAARQPNAECAYCHNAFYRAPSLLKRADTSRSGLVFCSRQHKDAAQRLDGIPDIQPSHYGTGNDYRRIAQVGPQSQCVRCGYNEHPEILEVNHIDCNRSNNAPENLEILCPNCHKTYHFVTKTGIWAT